MKKLTSIYLLIIHLCNIAGPLTLHQYLEYKSDKLFSREINQHHYNVNDLTEIRVPVKMFKINEWKGFQNLYGRIQFKNSAYNYVKIRITKSAIYLLCIPNYETTHLSDQNIIYAQQIPDIPVPKKEHVPFGKINLISYNNVYVNYLFSIPSTELRSNIQYKNCFFSNSIINKPSQPPDTRLFSSIIN